MINVKWSNDKIKYERHWLMNEKRKLKKKNEGKNDMIGERERFNTKHFVPIKSNYFNFSKGLTSI